VHTRDGEVVGRCRDRLREGGGFIHVSPNKDLESEFKKDSWKCYNKNKSTNL
jgi:hypothetical protein